MLKFNRMYRGDCRELLQQVDDETIDCLVTSPPYYQLRDYGTYPIPFDEGAYQLGREPSMEMYVTHLCDIFDDVKRVLKSGGSIWVNIGDTYSGGIPGTGSDTGRHAVKNGGVWAESTRFRANKPEWTLPDKCLCGIPWRFALEMCNRGWILRNDIIWYKPNSMPDGVRDRFTPDHEYLFFFTKINRGYYFEQQLEPHKVIDRRSKDKRGKRIVGRTTYFNGKYQRGAYLGQGLFGKNKRSVWKIHTRPSGVAHYATFPEDLIITPIQAGCPKYICTECGTPRQKIYKKHVQPRDRKVSGEDGTAVEGTAWNNNPRGHMGTPELELVGYTNCECGAPFEPGVVLDPFAGTGTTLITAYKMDRNFIGFELSEEFYKIAQDRIRKAMSNTRITDFMSDLKNGPMERFITRK